MSDPQLDVFKTAIAGRYALEGEIGRGTRATVYRGRDMSNGAPVAIKILRADLASALDSTRFLAQIRTAERVQHPGIIPFLHVGDAAGRLFCVRPFVDGESLRVRLVRDGQLPLADALAIAREIADALGSAHAQGLLHKDVKPENILLSGSRALLMDLGLSRAITRSMAETTTGSGLALGTPDYMSPEHASGGVEIDARADLYSLGCVLYEMLAGKPPFTGGPAHAVLMRTLKETPVSITAIRDGIPADVGLTIDRLLAKAPAGRYPDAEHLVEALAELR